MQYSQSFFMNVLENLNNDIDIARIYIINDFSAIGNRVHYLKIYYTDIEQAVSGLR